MNTINIIIQNKIACLLDMNSFIVCGNKNYTINFSFDEEWEGHEAKTARFKWGGKCVDVVFTGNQCPAPVILDTKAVKVGVYAGDLYTTTSANIRCISSIRCGKDAPVAPTPEVYDQIMQMINDGMLKGEDGKDGKDGIDGKDGVDGKDGADLYLGETSDTAYAGDKGKALSGRVSKSERDIAFLYAIAEQGGAFTKTTVSDTFNTRVTAGGLNIVDGSPTTLKKVVGSTVACKNLFDISKISETSNLSKTDSDIVVTNSYGTGSNKNVKELFPAVKAGITYTVACTVEANAPSYASNGMITALGGTNILAPHYFESAGSAYVKQAVVFTEEDLTRQVFFYGLADGGTGVANSTVRWKNLMLVEGNYTNTEMPPYQPYFTGLKSASFAGIESTNADGTETATLEFPKTPTPLGTTIDFETKNITDYGVDIVLTGTESWSYYSGNVNGVKSNGTICYGLLPYVDDKNENGVCTDADIGVFGQYGIVLGLNSTNVYWIGILDSLGYTTAGVEPTTEERNTAISKFTAYLAQRYADGNPVTIRYVSSVLQSETDFTDEQKAVGNEYVAYKNGSESILGNEESGAENTVEQVYYTITEG